MSHASAVTEGSRRGNKACAGTILIAANFLSVLVPPNPSPATYLPPSITTFNPSRHLRIAGHLVEVRRAARRFEPEKEREEHALKEDYETHKTSEANTESEPRNCKDSSLRKTHVPLWLRDVTLLPLFGRCPDILESVGSSLNAPSFRKSGFLPLRMGPQPHVARPGPHEYVWVAASVPRLNGRLERFIDNSASRTILLGNLLKRPNTHHVHLIIVSTDCTLSSSI